VHIILQIPTSAVGVTFITLVIARHTYLYNLLRSVLLALYPIRGHQTLELLVNRGMITMVQIKCTTLGFRPHVLPNVPLQVQRALCALFITFYSCAFLVKPQFRISPKYLASVVSCNGCPERASSFKTLTPLFLVNGIITIFCGLTEPSPFTPLLYCNQSLLQKV